MARLNISVTNEIAKKIQDVADKDGKTVSSVIAESFDLYSRLMDLGFNKGQVMSLIKYCQINKVINAVPIPGTILDQSINVALKTSEESLLKITCEGGRVLGELLKSVSPEIDSLISDLRELSPFIPVSKIDLKKEEGKIEFIVMGSGYSLGAAKVTAAGARCFLEVFGVKDMVETISDGFVKITGTI
ncbi:MAG: hypothetical protein ACP5UO_04710 [Thermoplasmata archaeon]